MAYCLSDAKLKQYWLTRQLETHLNDILNNKT